MFARGKRAFAVQKEVREMLLVNHFRCVLSYGIFSCEGGLASESDKDCPAIINSCEDNRGCTRYHDVSVKASGEVAM